MMGKECFPTRQDLARNLSAHGSAVVPEMIYNRVFGTEFLATG